MLDQLIHNKGLNGSYCEKVLGSQPKVDEIAVFFDTKAQLMHLISVNAILEYVEEEDFDAKELAAFKKGVASIGTFMAKCSQEREDRGSLKESND